MEIKQKGHLQRDREGESRSERCSANGPRRAHSTAAERLSIMRREGIRQLPGICLNSDKSAQCEHVLRKSGWHRGSVQLCEIRP